MSATLRIQIVDGENVNLAALLIPEYELAQDKTVHTEGVQFSLKAPTDTPLNR